LAVRRPRCRLVFAKSTQVVKLAWHSLTLKILKLAGHHIGDAHIPPSQDGHTMRVWIDGVPCTLEDALKMVEEEINESEQPG
jgi:hypothetical protein